MPLVNVGHIPGHEIRNLLNLEVQTAKAKFDNLCACELYAARGATQIIGTVADS